MRFIFLFVLLFSGGAFSQTSTITGTLQDKADQPVPFATIILRDQTDSSFVKGEISDENGTFVLEHIEHGEYILEARMHGFESYVATISVQEAEVTLPTISLLSAQDLDDVEVTVTRPFMTVKADRTIVHVEGSPASQGNTAWELIGKLPGVAILDGNIVLRGKNGVQITLNDKLLPFSGTDLENYLKSIHASQIKDIEIISNPPAQYDAQGNSGIINLILSKPSGAGFHGSIATGYGRGKGTNKPYATLNLSHSGEKGNLLFSISGNYSEFFNNLDVRKSFYDGDSVTAIIRNDNRLDFGNYSGVSRLSYDWFPTKRSNVSFLLSGALGGGIRSGLSNSQISTGTDILTTRIDFQSGSNDRWGHYSGNIHWNLQLDSTGQKIAFDVDAARFNVLSNNWFESRYSDAYSQPLDTIAETGIQGGPLEIYAFKADYSLPFGKDWQFDAGIKSSYVKSDRTVEFYFDGDENQLDTLKSNHFIYTENINAAYANVSKTFGKIATQLGLRMEQTNAIGDQRTYNLVFDRHYAQLFPTVFVSYPFKEKHTLSISTGRRINRPRYQQLNPFIRPIDATAWASGNPNLQPEFTYNTELTYDFKHELLIQASYAYTTQGIIGVLGLDPVTQITLQKDDNVDISHTYTLSLIYNKGIKKWWHLSANLTGFYTEYDGSLLGFYFNRSMPTFYGSLQNTFTMKKGWRIEQNYTYMHRNLYGTTKIEPMHNLTIGIRKPILKGKGSIAFNASDIFWTNYPRGTVDFNNVIEIWDSQRDTRTFYLHFTYQFGQGKAIQMRRNTGADDEKNRAN